MAGDVEVTGLDDLVRVTRALRAAGTEGKGLRKELYAGLNRATKPIRADLNAAIPETFPESGGLAARMAKKSRFSVSTRTNNKETGVRLVARGKSRRTLAAASRGGSFLHPVFRVKGKKVTPIVQQSKGVTKGLPEKAFEADKHIARAGVLQAIENVRRQIDRSV